MKSLLRYLKPYVKECLLAPLFKLLEAAFELAVPLVMAQMIDIGLAHNDKNYLLMHGVLLLGMGIFGLASASTAQYYCAKLAAGFGTRLRDDLFGHITRLSRQDIDGLGQSTLVTRLTNDSQQVQDGVNTFFRLVLRSPFVVFGALILVFNIDHVEGLIYTCTITILLALVFGLMRIAARLYKIVQNHLDSVLLLTSENLEGVRVIRAFRREQREMSEMNAVAGELRAEQAHVGDISGLLNPLTYAATNIGLVVVLAVGGHRVQLGDLTQGQLMAFINYSTQILIEGVKLANCIIQVSKSLACAKRIEQIFEVKPSMKEGSLNACREQPSLSLHDVTFVYPHAAGPALSHISFDVRPGETVGIIGGTGSGKTSLAALLMRFYDVTEGSIELGGHDIRSYSLASLHKMISIVEQGAQLFAGSIASNLRWGNLEAGEEELYAALHTAQADNIIEAKGGLDAEIEQLGRNLSGGQRQRLAIARALVRKPKVLILDDSSSALDFATDSALRKALRKDLAGTSCFIISQRVTSIRTSDKIIVLDHGHVAGIGIHDDLLETCSVYQEIYASQVKGGVIHA